MTPCDRKWCCDRCLAGWLLFFYLQLFRGVQVFLIRKKYMSFACDANLNTTVSIGYGRLVIFYCPSDHLCFFCSVVNKKFPLQNSHVTKNRSSDMFLWCTRYIRSVGNWFMTWTQYMHRMIQLLMSDTLMYLLCLLCRKSKPFNLWFAITCDDKIQRHHYRDCILDAIANSLFM